MMNTYTYEVEDAHDDRLFYEIQINAPKGFIESFFAHSEEVLAEDDGTEGFYAETHDVLNDIITWGIQTEGISEATKQVTLFFNTIGRKLGYDVKVYGYEITCQTSRDPQDWEDNTYTYDYNI